MDQDLGERSCGKQSGHLGNKWRKSKKETGWHTILNPVFQHKLGPLLTGLPPRGHAAPRGLPAELRELLVCLIENCMLLFKVHRDRILVRVTMEPTIRLRSSASFALQVGTSFFVHLVPRISHHCTFLRKGLKRMPRDEEGGLDIVFGEELEEALDAYGASEESWRKLMADLRFN